VNDWRRGSPPSYPPFTDEHRKRLVSIAEDDQESFFEQDPAGGIPSRLLLIALCRGRAALPGLQEGRQEDDRCQGHRLRR